MKRKIWYLLLILSLVVFSSCFRSDTSSSGSSSSSNDGKLTVQKAQVTLSRWVQDGQVIVQGVQEIPKENAAKADLTFSNFNFKADGSQRNYSGPGTAIFTRYNDGRWVLTRVATEQGFKSVWWNSINVEVP